MTRDDDPEVRIRELERALTEQARRSELTAPTYHRATTSPWITGPIGIRTPPQRPAFPARRLLFIAFLLAGLAAPVVAAVIFVGHLAGTKHLLSGPSGPSQPPSVSVSAPSTAPPAPPVGNPSSQSVVVNGTTVMSGPSLVELPPQSGDPGSPVQIAGAHGSKTLACNDRPISISGVSNSVNLTGHCTTVEVSGVENTVTVDTADKIITSGMDNRVTYHSGTPDIPDPGASNTVSRG